MGIEIIAAGTTSATMQMSVREDMGNTFGICHGGVIFTLADICFGFTANGCNEKAVTASSEIEFLNPANVGDLLEAQAHQAWRQGRNALYDVRIARVRIARVGSAGAGSAGEEFEGVAGARAEDVIALVRGRMRFIGGHHLP